MVERNPDEYHPGTAIYEAVQRMKYRLRGEKPPVENYNGEVSLEDAITIRESYMDQIGKQYAEALDVEIALLRDKKRAEIPPGGSFFDDRPDRVGAEALSLGEVVERLSAIGENAQRGDDLSVLDLDALYNQMRGVLLRYSNALYPEEKDKMQAFIDKYKGYIETEREKQRETMEQALARARDEGERIGRREQQNEESKRRALVRSYVEDLDERTKATMYVASMLQELFGTGKLRMHTDRIVFLLEYRKKLPGGKLNMDPIDEAVDKITKLNDGKLEIRLQELDGYNDKAQVIDAGAVGIPKKVREGDSTMHSGLADIEGPDGTYMGPSLDDGDTIVAKLPKNDATQDDGAQKGKRKWWWPFGKDKK